MKLQFDKEKSIFSFVFAVGIFPCFSETNSKIFRHVQDVFPNLSETQKKDIYTTDGFLNVTEKPGTTLSLTPVFTKANDSFDTIKNNILSINPYVVIESLQVVKDITNRSIDEIYTALSRIQNLAGRSYYSSNRKKEVPLFEEAVRISDLKKQSPLPDPQGNLIFHNKESMYIRIKDINFGNSFYRVDIYPSENGLLYAMTNARSLKYGIIPIIGEEKFRSLLYIETVQEGLLVYGIAATDVSNFVASQIHIPSAIRKRFSVIKEWMIDGLR